VSPTDRTLDFSLLIKIVILFILSVFVGALLAPPIYNGLISAGRSFESVSLLREVEFEKLVSRCVLISVLIGAFLMMRCAGLVTLEKQGFRRGVQWKTRLAVGFILGMASMAILLAAGGLTGAYVPGGESIWSVRFCLKMLGNLVGALLVGFIEEWLFRGVIFGTLRKAVGVAVAVLIASVFFSVVHFARPENPFGIVHASWDSAFRLMPYMFTYDDIRWSYEGFKMATLFFMGVSLCYFYARFRNLYFVIGLHAGWVWIMRFGDAFFDDRNQQILPYCFGPTPGIAKSGVALAMSLLFALLAAVIYYVHAGKREAMTLNDLPAEPSDG